MWYDSCKNCTTSLILHYIIIIIFRCRKYVKKVVSHCARCADCFDHQAIIYPRLALFISTSSRLGDRAFSAAGPRLWSSLPTQCSSAWFVLGQFLPKTENVFNIVRGTSAYWLLMLLSTVYKFSYLLTYLFTYLLTKQWYSLIGRFLCQFSAQKVETNCMGWFNWWRSLNCTVKPRLHDTTCCQTGRKCLYTRYNRLSTGCQTRWQTGLTTGCIVYTNIQSVVKLVWQPVWQPAVSCIQPVVKPVVQPGLTTALNEQSVRSTRLSNRLYNAVWQPAVSCKRGIRAIYWLRRLCHVVTWNKQTV